MSGSSAIERAQNELARERESLARAVEALKELVRDEEYSLAEARRRVEAEEELDEVTVQQALWMLVNSDEVQLTDDFTLRLRGADDSLRPRT